ncbi:MAG: hypothetical protein RML38_07465 [Bacteroidia bacterium]|nr:hypothetical protein [Bacteroidia bacterium]
MLCWIVLWHTTLIANSFFQDTVQVRKAFLAAISKKDTFLVRNFAEKYAFYGDSVQRAWVYSQLAYFYLSQSQPQSALKYARKALKYEKDRKAAAKLFYVCQNSMFLQSLYNYSDLYKDSVFTYTTDSILKRQSLFTYLLSQIHQYQWRAAQELTKKYFGDNSRYWDSVFSFHTSHVRLKSVTKAVILSYLFPGLGQWYAGFYAQGVISFVFVFLSILVLYFIVKKQWYLIAYFTFLGVFFRFYLGGAKFAQKQIHFYNLMQQEKCVQNLKIEIQKKMK